MPSLLKSAPPSRMVPLTTTSPAELLWVAGETLFCCSEAVAGTEITPFIVNVRSESSVDPEIKSIGKDGFGVPPLGTGVRLMSLSIERSARYGEKAAYWLVIVPL